MSLPAASQWSTRLDQGASLPRPGPVHGEYPIRPAAEIPASPLLAWCRAWMRAAPRPTARQDRRFLQTVCDERLAWRATQGASRRQRVQALRQRLGSEGFTSGLTAQAFALLAELVQAHMGLNLHDVQLLGARWMLGQCLIEMATGEGKTLTVFLSAATGALAGIPVHVLTANDYLARRDALQLGPLYEALGLRVAFVTAASTPEARRLAYQADVVHVTAKEVAFDHLRDTAARLAGNPGGVVLRGLCMALLDEADSILIDEACTPLILAQAADVQAAEQRYRIALYLARQLQEQEHFVCDRGQAVRLTNAGAQRLADLADTGGGLDGAWRWRRYRHEQVLCGLQALHTFRRDVHYLVRDGAVHIIDDTTGRLAIGRAWSRGLHQMIAIKEGLVPEPENETLAQTSYQAFFPRYGRLAGLSGTVHEDRAELLRVYGLPVRRVPLRMPSRRVVQGTAIVEDQAAKWAWVAQRAAEVAAQGRPVLIGTDAVADSDALSAALRAAGVPHQLLNARQDGAQSEAEQGVIAQAGAPGCITVATHMAGRGTDVALSPEALAQGGLHVINTHLNRSGRIDRQLLGRCARQGQPGSAETILSWADAPWRDATRVAWLKPLLALARRRMGGGWLSRVLCWLVQREAQARARAQRWAMLQSAQVMARQLAMAGREDWD